MLQIDALPAFNDNYIWLYRTLPPKRCAVVDPGDAAPVLEWLARHPDWVLSDILITHHHFDHVGGVAQLHAHTNAKVWGPAPETIPARQVALNDGDRIEVLGLEFQILLVPGHTLGHIAYYHQDPTAPLLFCGDTLFGRGLRPTVRRHPRTDTSLPESPGRAARPHRRVLTHDAP